ncbi:MAG TPA: hypothetical protein VMV69_17960 [Pirellulales bacterium]|nr:hypothetical protein [Pirellulales bacterium]
MSLYHVEPGQRRTTHVGDKIMTVLVLTQAVVPFGYWICQNEEDGARRIVAAEALFALEPVVSTPAAILADSASPVPSDTVATLRA